VIKWYRGLCICLFSVIGYEYILYRGIRSYFTLCADFYDFLILGVMCMSNGSCAPDFCRISVEGIVGSGLSAFLWELERFGSSHIQWTNEFECIWDGHWKMSEWFDFVAHKYSQWKYGDSNWPNGSTVFYERSIFSSMVYANWDYNIRHFLTLAEYQTLKSDYEKLISDCALPHLVIYFETTADNSPLPKDQFIALDDQYETWLSLMESKGVQVMRIQPPKVFGLEYEFWMERLIGQVEIYTRATYR